MGTRVRSSEDLLKIISHLLGSIIDSDVIVFGKVRSYDLSVVVGSLAANSNREFGSA